MHNSSIDNRTFLTEGMDEIYATFNFRSKPTHFCIKYFIEGTEEEVSMTKVIGITHTIAKMITLEKAQKTVELLLKLRDICTNDNELKKLSNERVNYYINLQATRDAYNYYLGDNPKSFVDRVAPQHASTSEHQSHVERYVDPATVKAKAESMESDIESSQSSLRRRHVPENIKSEGASSQTFVEKYADHKKDKPEKGCLETVRAATGGYCSIQ